MLCPPHPPAPLVQNWLERHRDPRSFLLHMVGIPPVIVSVLLFPVFLASLSRSVLLLSVSLFVVGYLLQFLGHALDGTEPGELTGLKRLAGRVFGGLHARPAKQRRVA